MTKDFTITINVTNKPKIRSAIYIAGAQVGVIGIGIVTQSVAMQWVGFCFLILWLIGATKAWQTKNSDLTIDQAFVRLSQIQREADN
ncbi:hypothetical protein [Ketogulonicigenium vulgare]|uniref:Uncharacterized protein n=1 Tax=Ketogulonicigenium vulgare (strain WSH-001) TaxID=759362 RepID=F9YA17_KETVW|nr:hypothetical protein [Ketogulonicigenium vulgare]AEM41428.1 hypothetical protein KVU_1589 [Ketogulonicigenium vulgare WSH-001]ALJ81561.1 hypothetical protein KVH_10475 [Ketogulonicigenium vulgare]AOZ55170.1 hypothetical protein KVC_2163 [Ketogulonicigenium vulgare]